MIRDLTIVMIFLFSQFLWSADQRPGFFQEWIKLLHMEENWLRNYHSQIKDPSFFLSKTGHKDPEAELSANTQELRKNPKYPCQFPARAQILAKEFQIPIKICPEIESWKRSLNPDSVSLVFVSQYHSNPASAFGHSFLLLKNKNKPTHLNYAISNAARMPENVSSYDYIFKGLFGGFPAHFSIEPFYLKIQEYNYIENRDIWSYDLDLDELQIDQLLNHLWEVDHILERYFFAHKNCSVYIYNMLAAIHPKLNFISSRSLYVMPVSTIKLAKDIVGKETFLPSHRKKLKHAISNLNSADLKLLKTQLYKVEKIQSPAIANIVIDYSEFLKTKSQGKLNEVQKEVYETALLARSKMGLWEDSLSPAPASPILGLGSWRTGLLQNRNFKDFEFSFLYHDLLDPDASYLDFSEVVLLNFGYDLKKNYLKNLTLFSFSNFVDSAFFDPQISWQVNLSLHGEAACKECWSFHGEALGGKTKSIHDLVQWYFLIGYGKQNPQEQSLLFKTGLLFKFWRIKGQIEGKYLESNTVKSNDSFIAELAAPFGQDFVLSTSFSTENLTTLRLGYYF